MKELVSNRWIGFLALVASVSVVWAIFTPFGLSRAGYAWLSAWGYLALLSAALWAGMTPIRSIRRAVLGLEAEPILALATSAAPAGPGVVNRLKGDAPL